MNRIALFVLAMSVLANAALAQLQYRIGTFAGDALPITWPTLPGGGWEWHTLSGGVVQLPVLTSTTDIVVQIADATPIISTDLNLDGMPSPDDYGTPFAESDADLNQDLVLAAPAGSVAPLRVRVWIANKDLNPLSNLIDDPTSYWTAGIHDWTGSIKYTLDGVKWDDLRDRVRLNANLSRNYLKPVGQNPNATHAYADGEESIDCGSIIRFNAAGVQDFPEDVDAGRIIGFLRGRVRVIGSFRESLPHASIPSCNRTADTGDRASE